MYIAEVTLDYHTFRGVPLYNEDQVMVFVSVMPYDVDGIKANGQILSVPKSFIRTVIPKNSLHTFERFSILHILDDEQEHKWKSTLVTMFKGRGTDLDTYLSGLNIRELLVFIELWESGDLLVEGDTIMHHAEHSGMISFEIQNEDAMLAINELLRELSEETTRRLSSEYDILGQLKQRFIMSVTNR